MTSIIEHYELFNLNDEIIIFPSIADNNKALKINKKNQKISFEECKIPEGSEKIEIEGIIGIHELEKSNYLIVITKKKLITKFLQHKFYQIEEYAILPITEHEEESFREYHKNVISSTLSIPSFYFSYTYDLTRSYQTQSSSQGTIFDRCNLQFVWNHKMIKSLPEMMRLPIIQGFIGRSECAVEPEVKSNIVIKKVELILISRRSNQRVGRRYYVRGAEQNGEVANYVETEQIICVGEKYCSYVQIRGSIPLLWSQIPNIKYKPKIAISQNEEENYEAFKNHFENIKKQYKKITAVSLTDLKGGEKSLGDKYEEYVNKMNDQDIQLKRVDFHKLMKNMKELMNYMETIYKENDFSWCQWNINSKEHEQKGVFRVNCVDNLDRTNVCESVFGRLTAEQFLKEKENNILMDQDKITDNACLNAMFVNLWADNGDQMSKQYTGTCALKNDITRTGKRTKMGLINDGTNSILRYFINNFYDGETTDHMNVFLGNCEGTNTKYHFKGMNKIIIYGLIGSLFIAVVCGVISLLTGNTGLFMTSILGLIGFLICSTIALIQGKKVTIPPTLMPIRDYQVENKAPEQTKKEKED
ncbi:hypothetical protein ENUP19_0084G0020 [Entamoeba nuttalli]|uniref:Phosphoinositide phosphatase, putative n=2 Tax=Entamoeba nuttalli TaxID=412467 RepID=K2HS20_ENTNP|nr:phosphoinositide phosphatase, putative [Entamoeba nuttalli P19]EKE38850.1 phosphoinositide phosphatase, putative [Entamoeba nuttalli P19]|eukprot:XP_008858816.1 phosphoinositide phosphatase, putative [Entamoeba nuttalli P19]